MIYINEILRAKDDMHPIPYEEFEKWSKSDSLEDLELLSILIFEKSFYEKIKPFLSIKDYQRVLLPYFKRCIIENHEKTNISTRYEACWAMLNWFNYLWKEKRKHHDQLLEIKIFLFDLYKNGDEKIRLAIVNGTLEHLFENKKIREFFDDWKKDSLLYEAYKEACLFSDSLK